MMLYPIGIQDFGKLRNNGCIYVDKSALVYQMTRVSNCCFLSRPRRFGKSLLVSTLEAYFLGQEELFKGLAIGKLETEWKQYPVLHLDLNARNYENEGSLKAELNKHLVVWEQTYGIMTDSCLAPEERFYNVIRAAYRQTGRQVAVLVDEYDKPLLSTIDNRELHDVYRNVLKAFFSVLKSTDACIRFVFITGVSRFSHVSIFSDLNNLKDISMDARYADICGISEQELYVYFDSSIRELADANGMTFDEACEQLRRQYDGYHFCANSVGIYNPFSLLNTFDSLVFNDYWFSTGTPTFLVKLLKTNDYALQSLKGIRVSPRTLNSVTENHTNPIPVLYQSGYLTIRDYDRRRDRYTLDFPNLEVERGFFDFLLPYYTPMTETQSDSLLEQFTDDVCDGRPERFMQKLQQMLSGKSYMVAGGDREVHFQNSIYIIFKMLGFHVSVEQATSRGRMDVTIQTEDYIYIIELKLDKTAEEALRQIKDNHYARPFQLDKRKLYLIGVNFSSETRTVEDWVVEAEQIHLI